MIYADQRRIGNHGIGRFARQVLSCLDYCPVPLTSDPDSPIDPLRLTLALRNLTSHDLFFSPGYNPPLYCSAPFVFTLCDLNHIDREENSSVLKRLYYATVVKRACRLAANIVTISEFSRKRIIEWSGVQPEKVVNVQCGVDSQYHPGVAPFDLPYSYLLCVSNRRLHKNEFRTVTAFAHAHLKSDLHMVLTGLPTAELTAHIQQHHVQSRVHFLGTVPETQLPSLYRSAEALVFASLYEGFGLPVVEAMACGTPVITSNTTSLPELAGDAALLVDPNSVDQITAAMERIINDAALRQLLRAKGLTRAALFPWSTTITRVHELLAANLRKAAK